MNAAGCKLLKDRLLENNYQGTFFEQPFKDVRSVTYGIMIKARSIKGYFCAMSYLVTRMQTCTTVLEYLGYRSRLKSTHSGKCRPISAIAVREPLGKRSVSHKPE